MENADQVLAFLRQLALWSVPVLAAVILHEVAHGAVAWRLGDDTAHRMGRLTLNPLPHIDPIGTILLPAVLLLMGAPVFGYARPVPVTFSKLRDPRRGMVLVALAGPMTNVVLAAISALAFRALVGFLTGLEGAADGFATRVGATIVVPLALMARHSVVINVVLAVFNLLPIPPLDGGRVLTGILPAAQARLIAAVEPFGFLILVLLLTTRTLGAVLETPVRLLLQVLL
jgi:Zn-dependent protease